MSDSLLRTVRFTPYRKGLGPRFTLRLWDTYQTVNGKCKIRYELAKHWGNKTDVLFSGSDFHCSPMHAIDSDETVASIMTFLTLRPGDTDRDYFDGYTPMQLEYCSNHAETLAGEVLARFGEL
jgi:hypothetical protein